MRLWILLLGLFAWTPLCMGVCKLTWNGDKLANLTHGKALSSTIRLTDNKKELVDQVSVEQLAAFQVARERVSKEVGGNPRYVICGDKEPNAFASATSNGPVVGVTLGMIKFVNGDADQAAYVLGHEWAHHQFKHMEANRGREQALVVAGMLIGALLGGRHHGGLGMDLGRAGAYMVVAKFTRDQEREADEHGLKYMVAAGFNPDGAVRAARAFAAAGIGGSGLFFDSHPGWEEREAKVRELIAANPPYGKAFAEGGRTPLLATAAPLQQVAVTAAPEPSSMEPGQPEFIDALAAFRRKDMAAALAAVRTSADAGYTPAMTLLGYTYSQGLGVEKDDAEALRYYRQAADQGHALAQANLGFFYLQGRAGLAADAVEAGRLFKLSADQGDARGMANLGTLYMTGNGGLPKDPAEAARLYRLAADKHDVAAKAALGYMYLAGLGGLTRDQVAARKLFQEAAAAGNANGQAGLGVCYANGCGGLPRNPAEAERLWKLAAAQGNAIAKRELEKRAVPTPP